MEAAIEAITNFVKEYNTILFIALILISITTLVLQILSYRKDVFLSKLLWTDISNIDKDKLIEFLKQNNVTSINTNVHVDSQQSVKMNTWQAVEKGKETLANNFEQSQFTQYPAQMQNNNITDNNVDIEFILNSPVLNSEITVETDINYSWIDADSVSIIGGKMNINTLTEILEVEIKDGFLKIFESSKTPEQKLQFSKSVINNTIKNNRVEVLSLCIWITNALIEYKRKDELVDLIKILDKIATKLNDSKLNSLVMNLK